MSRVFLCQPDAGAFWRTSGTLARGFVLTGALLTALAFCAEAHPGVGIVMDSRGNVFYTDLKHIWKIDSQGKRTIAVHNVHSHELYVDEKDNLYGEHLWYEGATGKWGHYVWKL